MKKTILMAFAALLFAVPTMAQKVNENSFLSKIEKSNSDIADAKKGIKASTWINRAKIFYETAVEPTKSLFVGIEAAMLKLAVGDPASTGAENINGVDYETWVYPYFTAYLKDGKVATWKQTRWILKDAPSKAIEAYAKAYELDGKSGEKVKGGLQQVSDFLSQVGNAGIESGEYREAAAAFSEAFKAQSVPAYGEPNAELLYFAGYLLTVDGANHPESFVEGAEHLKKAIEMGYADEEGNIYYYLFHCYYGQREANHQFVLDGKQALLTGIEKFPKNERILDGLMQLYTSEEGVGDPADLIGLMDKALAENPENVDLWFGRGRVFYALNNYDESISSFKKVVELKPDLFEGNYYLGVFYTLKGDAMNKEMNEKQYSSQAAYDADLAVVNQIYLDAVPWFEKAVELKANDPDTLEFLKSLCFRLRDEAGMMEKYNKYNELFKQVKGE